MSNDGTVIVGQTGGWGHRRGAWRGGPRLTAHADRPPHLPPERGQESPRGGPRSRQRKEEGVTEPRATVRCPGPRPDTGLQPGAPTCHSPNCLVGGGETLESNLPCDPRGLSRAWHVTRAALRLPAQGGGRACLRGRGEEHTSYLARPELARASAILTALRGGRISSGQNQDRAKSRNQAAQLPGLLKKRGPASTGSREGGCRKGWPSDDSVCWSGGGPTLPASSTHMSMQVRVQQHQSTGERVDPV